MITIKILGTTPEEEAQEAKALIGDRSIYDTVEQLQGQGAEIQGQLAEIEGQLEDTGWNPLTLAEGVAPQNATTYPCRFRKIGKVVYIEGCVKGFTETVKVICTLPEGFRPSREFYCQAPTNEGKTDTFRFYTDGRIERMATTNTPTAANQYHFIATVFATN